MTSELEYQVRFECLGNQEGIAQKRTQYDICEGGGIDIWKTSQLGSSCRTDRNLSDGTVRRNKAIEQTNVGENVMAEQWMN